VFRACWAKVGDGMDVLRCDGALWSIHLVVGAPDPGDGDFIGRPSDVGALLCFLPLSRSEIISRLAPPSRNTRRHPA
jgi:hypothetical protein